MHYPCFLPLLSVWLRAGFSGSKPGSFDTTPVSHSATPDAYAECSVRPAYFLPYNPCCPRAWRWLPHRSESGEVYVVPTAPIAHLSSLCFLPVRQTIDY